MRRKKSLSVSCTRLLFRTILMFYVSLTYFKIKYQPVRMWLEREVRGMCGQNGIKIGTNILNCIRNE